MKTSCSRSPCLQRSRFSSLLAEETQKLLTATAHSDTSSKWDSLHRHIGDMESELYVLKHHQNALAPPNRLPLELLAQILLEFANLGPSTREYPWPRANLKWIDVTRVCRHWRTVALECPELWSCISHTSEDVTNAMIHRSKAAPLSIQVDLDSVVVLDDPSHLSSMISPQMHRLRCLRLYGVDTDGLSRIFVDSGPTTMLEELVLMPESLDSLPENFLRNGAANVAYFKVGSFRIPDWRVLPLGPALTNLQIRCHHSSSRPLWSELMPLFSQMDNLKKLKLSNFLPLATPLSLEKVSFTKLNRLALEDPLTSIATLVRQVRFPVSAWITMEFTDGPCDAGSIDRVLGSLEECVGGLRRWKDGIEELSLSGQSEGNHSHHNHFIRASSFSLSFDSNLYFSRGKKRTNKALNISFRSNEFDTRHFLTQLNERMGFSPLRRLRIHGSSDLSSTLWSTLFTPLSELGTIEIHHSAIRGFFEAVNRVPSPGKPILPSLSTVQFYRADFSEIAIPRDVRRFIEGRPSGSPLLEVDIWECRNFDRSDYSNLSGFRNAFVEWDGEVNFSSEEE